MSEQEKKDFYIEELEFYYKRLEEINIEIQKELDGNKKV